MPARLTGPAQYFFYGILERKTLPFHDRLDQLVSSGAEVYIQ
jgi:hypothetical protein